VRRERLLKKVKLWWWSDGSLVKSTDCSSRGPRFNSQHLHGSSQLSVTPVSGDLVPSHTCRPQKKRKRKKGKVIVRKCRILMNIWGEEVYAVKT
jgi:hypothetical protein